MEALGEQTRQLLCIQYSFLQIHQNMSFQKMYLMLFATNIFGGKIVEHFDPQRVPKIFYFGVHTTCKGSLKLSLNPESSLAPSPAIFDYAGDFLTTKNWCKRRDFREKPFLWFELELERVHSAHKAFLLALIRSGKINTENLLKVLAEVKQSGSAIDTECIYCKYS